MEIFKIPFSWVNNYAENLACVLEILRERGPAPMVGWNGIGKGLFEEAVIHLRSSSLICWDSSRIELQHTHGEAEIC